MKQTVVALFNDPSQAIGTLNKISNTLGSDQISFVTLSKHNPETLKETSYTEKLESLGGTLEELQGKYITVEPINLPNIGYVAALGPLSGALLQEDKGLADSLIYYGIGNDEATNLENLVKEGRSLVVIETDNSKINEISNLLNNYGGDRIQKWNKNTGKVQYPFG